MLMFPAGRRPWLPVLMRVLFEQVPAILHANVADKPKVTDLFTSISVQGLDVMRAEIMDEHASAPTYDIDNVSAVATSLMLGFKSHYVFADCVGAGLLTKNPDKSVTYASVLDFSRRFIFANEAAARSGATYSDVVAWLANHGVLPKYRFRKGGTVFDRDLVEPLLEAARDGFPRLSTRLCVHA
jgi:hypothetical protein